MIDTIKKSIMLQFLNLLFAATSSIRDEKAFRMAYSFATYLSKKIVRKDYYVAQIERIKELFDNNHPSLDVTKKILRNINPHQRKVLLRVAIINQLLLGTNKRKAFSEQEDGFYPPGFFVISPSMKCNLNCYGCYAGYYNKDAELTFDEIDRVVTEAKEMGIYFCVVSGGEPLFYPRIFDLFRKHKDMVFLMFTNGSLIDAKMCQEFVKVGNVLPSISLEGFRDLTDKRRGQGHFSRIMNAMDLMKEAGLLFGFSVTLTRENSEFLSSDEFIDFMIDKGCIYGWFFMYVPIGREPNYHLMPTPQQRGHQFERLTVLRDSKPILLADFWNDGPVVGGCIAAGRKYFHINANGDVEPCVFTHFATHNIRKSTLREALSAPLFKSIHKQLPVYENLLRPCTLIDKPDVSRRAVNECNAYFTHEGADIIFKDLANEMDQYAREYATIADSLWKRYYNHEKKI
jgi:MoaA/NifB/PqqE/SkfB family radical SAM enzyme